MIHELALEQRNLRGHLSRGLEPVLTIDGGDGHALQGEGEVSRTATGS